MLNRNYFERWPDRIARVCWSVSGSFILSRFFAYFFINEKSMSPAAWAIRRTQIKEIQTVSYSSSNKKITTSSCFALVPRNAVLIDGFCCEPKQSVGKQVYQRQNSNAWEIRRIRQTPLNIKYKTSDNSIFESELTNGSEYRKIEQ